VDSPANGSTIKVLTRCTYPNNTSYNFVYGDWGIVTKIEQRSSSWALRSHVSYNYPTAGTALSDHPTFTQQEVNRGFYPFDVWSYAVTKSGGQVSSYQITDPGGTITTTNLFTSGWQTGLVSSVTIKQGPTTLRTIANDWIQDNMSVGYQINPRISRVTTTLNDSGQQSKVEFTYLWYGNLVNVLEFDYGFLLKRYTVTSYLGDANYTNRHILDRPTQVLVYDGNNNLKARTDFAYDSTSLTSVAGAAQHDDAGYGSGLVYRGNVSAITRYSNAAAGTGAVTKQFFYDSLGNLLKAQLDCCQEREWVFTSGTQYAYPTTIKTGPPGASQLSVSRTYEFATGLVKDATDENLKTTTFTYDSMNRITQVTRPDGINLTNMYDDAAAQPASASTTPINATDSITQVTITDGLGRVIQQKTTSAGGVIYSATDTQYDAVGRVTAVSNPYAPGETLAWTYNTYDALSRILTVTPPGAAGSYSYSYMGNEVTATDPAGKRRRTYTDALGRLVQVHEPGYAGGASGSGWVTINGSLQEEIGEFDPWTGTYEIIYDTGTVSVTVDDYTATTVYGEGSTKESVAAALRSIFNTASASPVTASGTGATVNLIAKQAGAHTNYSLSVAWTWDTYTFINPSFTVTKSGNNLTGGADGATGTPSLNTPLVTVYKYDPLENLTLVTQGVQQRTYVYDSMGRLTSATTPEGGTASYTYTNFSAVQSRTDARGIATTYTYLRRTEPADLAVLLQR
jgi:YD repeat-containing protein